MTMAHSDRVDRGPDPRPVVRPGPHGGPVVVGTRCRACGRPSLERVEQCPLCWEPADEVGFARTGTVFSATVLHIPVAGRRPPIALAYVDLDDGPRLLGHGSDPQRRFLPGDRVMLVGVTEDGDPRFGPAEVTG